MENLAIQNLFSVKGKIAVVTGGGSGLGEMMATALVKNGARVLIASRKEPQLKEVSERLTKMGPGSCEYIIGVRSHFPVVFAVSTLFPSRAPGLIHGPWLRNSY